MKSTRKKDTKKNKTVVIHVRVPNELKTKLDLLSRKFDRPLSHTIRRILSRGL